MEFQLNEFYIHSKTDVIIKVTGYEPGSMLYSYKIYHKKKEGGEDNTELKAMLNPDSYRLYKPKFNEGDKIVAIDDRYTFTSKQHHFEGTVVENKYEFDKGWAMNVRIDKCDVDSEIGEVYEVHSNHFVLASMEDKKESEDKKEVKQKIKVGDIVKCISDGYGVTSKKNQCIGKVVSLNERDEVVIKVIEICYVWKEEIGEKFTISLKDVELMEDIPEEVPPDIESKINQAKQDYYGRVLEAVEEDSTMNNTQKRHVLNLLMEVWD